MASSRNSGGVGGGADGAGAVGGVGSLGAGGAGGNGNGGIPARYQVWPSSGFRMTQNVRLQGFVCAVPLPASMFKRDGKFFCDLDLAVPSTVMYAISVQLVLHVLYVAHTRLMRRTSNDANSAPSMDLPLEVYLETLCVAGDSGPEAYEYRLWVCQRPGSPVDLNAIMKQAVQSKKKVVNADGEYIDLLRGAEHIADIPGARRSLGIFDLFRIADSPAREMEIISAASRVPRSSAHIHDLFYTRSPNTAIVNTSLAVHLSQRNIRTYQRVAADHTYYELDHRVGVYRLHYMYWDVFLFFAKFFPHKQLQPDYTLWEERLRALAIHTDRMARESTAKRTAHERRMRAAAARAGGPAPAPGPDPAPDAPAVDGPAEGGAGAGAGAGAEDAGPQYHINGPREELVVMEADELMDLQRGLGLHVEGDGERQTGPFVGDHLDALRMEADNSRKVIEGNFFYAVMELKDGLEQQLKEGRIDKEEMDRRVKNGTDELRRIMNGYLQAMYTILVSKFETFATGEAAKVSDTATSLYKYAKENGLWGRMENGDYDVVISDTSLTPHENWLAATTQGFNEYERITFHQSTATFLYVAFIDRFRREVGLRLNLLLTGDPAGGKSYLMGCVRNNIGKDTFIDKNSESRRASSNNITITDGIMFNDDADATEIAGNKDNRGGELKALMTGQMNKHDVTEIDKNEAGRTERRRVTYTFLFYGQFVENTNKGITEVLADTNSTDRAKMLAYYSRYITVHVNTVKDGVHSVQGSKSLPPLTGARKTARDRFREGNILRHIIAMEYYHLQHVIAPMTSPNMDVFDRLIPELFAHLDSHGLKEDTVRNTEQIRLWCMHNVLLRAINELFFCRTGRHYRSRYQRAHLLDLVPVCTENDVYLAFSYFFPVFYPSELNVIFRVLRRKIERSIASRDNEVVYFDPFDKPEDLINPGLETANAVGRAAGFGRDPRGAGPGAPDGLQYPDRVASAAAGAGFIPASSEYADPSGGPGGFGGGRGGGMQFISRQRAQLIRKERTVSFVCFRGMTRERLAKEILMEAQDEAHQPSSPAINYCLNKLQMWMVSTLQYHVGTAGGAPMALDEPPQSRPALVERYGDGIYINLRMLQKESPYANLCVSAIRSTCTDTTIARRVLLGLPNHECTWFHHVEAIRPTARRRVAYNHSYRSPAVQMLLEGVDDRDRVSDEARYALLHSDVNLEAAALLRFFSTLPITGALEDEMVYSHYSVAVTAANLALIIQDIGTAAEDKHRALCVYPDDLIKAHRAAKKNLARLAAGHAVEGMEIGRESEIAGTQALRLPAAKIPAIQSRFRHLANCTAAVPDLRALRAMAADERPQVHPAAAKALDNIYNTHAGIDRVDDEVLPAERFEFPELPPIEPPAAAPSRQRRPQLQRPPRPPPRREEAEQRDEEQEEEEAEAPQQEAEGEEAEDEDSEAEREQERRRRAKLQKRRAAKVAAVEAALAAAVQVPAARKRAMDFAFGGDADEFAEDDDDGSPEAAKRIRREHARRLARSSAALAPPPSPPAAAPAPTPRKHSAVRRGEEIEDGDDDDDGGRELLGMLDFEM